MASLSFKDKLFATYPIPRSVSIWEGDGVSSFAVSSLDDLISSCVDELRSDLYITEYVHCSSQSTSLPEDAFAVVNAKIDFDSLRSCGSHLPSLFASFGLGYFGGGSPYLR